MKQMHPFRSTIGAAGALLIAVSATVQAAPSAAVTRATAERQHGITLPKSAKDLQHTGDADTKTADRGAATLFEMSEGNLAAFLAQLTVLDRKLPAKAKGDPTVNGWNVWPRTAKTFVPGNKEYGGFKPTWKGVATPQKMLSCESTTGDWLHVEIWEIGEQSLVVKVYTDWN